MMPPVKKCRKRQSTEVGQRTPHGDGARFGRIICRLHQSHQPGRMGARSTVCFHKERSKKYGSKKYKKHFGGGVATRKMSTMEEAEILVPDWKD